jgi:hypothetical protein
MTRRSRISVLTLAFFMSLALQASLLPFAAHARPLKGFSTVNVVDANGKAVGIATSSGGQQVFLMFKVGEQVFTIFVARNRIFGGSPLLRFLSPDCSGAPLLVVFPDQDDIYLLTPFAIAPPGSTIYAPDPQAAPQTITVGSMLSGDGSCLTGEFSELVVPAVALIDLDTEFTPPFKVKP